MTFEEWLGAKKETALLDYLRQYVPPSAFSPSVHARLLPLLRDFFLTGGMPEAVKRFIETGDLREVFDAHAGIVQTYLDDFGKYGSRIDPAILRRVFNHVPVSVGRKFKYAAVNPAWQAARIRQAVDLLVMAGVIYRVHHTHGNGVPLAAEADDGVFKPLFLDVGLMNSILGVRDIPAVDLETARFVNEGGMAEQFIGQHLLSADQTGLKPVLHYWLREGKKNNAEVDYLIQDGVHVVPVEVKAGRSGTLKSLLHYVREKKPGKAIRFDLNMPSVQDIRHKMGTGTSAALAEVRLFSYPLYLAGQLPRLLAEI